MRLVVQPHASHNRHIIRRQRPQELLDLVFLARRFGGQRVVAREDFDFQPALLGQGVDVGPGVVRRDDGLAVLDAAVFGRDVAD